MDRVLKSLINDVLLKQEIKSEGDDKDYELFANYAIVSKEFKKEFNISLLSTGNGDDTGIDGIAIIINGHLVESIDEVEDLFEQYNELEIEYIFIQTKNTKGFEGKEINNFGFGVEDFFAETPRLRRNQEIKDFSEISNLIYSNAPKFKANPLIKLFYVTAGNYTEDQNLEGIKEKICEDLKGSNLFSSVSFKYVDQNEIIKIYRNLKNKLEVVINFKERVTLPEINRIQESYLGMLPLNEFMKLINDENGNLRNIFYDNIRDFQGIKNPINSEIHKTLDSNQPELFSILNNGITIVANDIRTTGNKFSIVDYQVVNGCQTSNVIFDFFKSKREAQFSIPIKLIVTSDDAVKNKITIATNSQTAIKREQLQAMTDFQKNLEQFYSSYQGDLKLFYERRAGQYQSDPNVIKARIITIQNQIKAFSSIFYENPDRVTTYFGSIVRQYIEIDDPKIFNEKHKHILYYLAGLAYYRLDSFFRSRCLDTNFRKIKFFLLFLFRKLIRPKVLASQYMNSEKRVSKYCDPIFDILRDREKSLDCFKKTIDIVKCSGKDFNNKQLIKQTEFTKSLIRTMGQDRKTS